MSRNPLTDNLLASLLARRHGQARLLLIHRMASGKRVAVPAFRGRVSPVFDWAEILAVCEPEGRQREVSLAGLTPPGRVARLQETGAETLICGGISAALLAMVEAGRIEVIPHIAGSIEEVLAAYSQGLLANGCFAMPGCRCHGGSGRGIRKRRCGMRRGGSS